MRKNIKIGLFGFGCVGYGLYEVIKKTPALKAEILHICVKQKNKQRPLPEESFTYEKEKILNDPEVNVVVELIDDAQAALEIVREAMKNGKHVVSANKKMIAENFEELLILQRQHKVSFLYEAACCASIPIIRNLEEYYDNDLLESIEGIVNGSTNYILSKTIGENKSYDVALKEAQELGYAESDHSLDTSGTDAKYKLQILLAHAFGRISRPYEVFHQGIDKLGETEIRYAREKKLRIKLLAKAYRLPSGKIAAYVLPAFVKEDEKLFNVENVYNGLITKSAFADTQFFMGRGAGAYPTASAVLSDLSALSYDYRYEYKKISNQQELASPADVYLKVLLSYPRELGQKIGRGFAEISESYEGGESNYKVGIISLESLIETQSSYNNTCSFVLIEALQQEQVEALLQRNAELIEWA